MNTTLLVNMHSKYIIQHKVNRPAWLAARVYHTQQCEKTFQEDWEAHLLFGYVFSTPEYFIMGRPVCSKAPDEEICNPMISFDPDHCDMWHIFLMAGDTTAAWSCMPYFLPKISFQGKNNNLRKYSFSQLKRKLNQ